MKRVEERMSGGEDESETMGVGRCRVLNHGTKFFFYSFCSYI